METKQTMNNSIGIADRLPILNAFPFGCCFETLIETPATSSVTDDSRPITSALTFGGASAPAL